MQFTVYTYDIHVQHSYILASPSGTVDYGNDLLQAEEGKMYRMLFTDVVHGQPELIQFAFGGKKRFYILEKTYIYTKSFQAFLLNFFFQSVMQMSETFACYG